VSPADRGRNAESRGSIDGAAVLYSSVMSAINSIIIG
jgi:hypothetical protein